MQQRILCPEMSKFAVCDWRLFLNSLEVFKDIKNKREMWWYKKKKKMQKPSGYIFLKTLEALSNCDIRVKILVFCVLKKRYRFY